MEKVQREAGLGDFIEPPEVDFFESIQSGQQANRQKRLLAQHQIWPASGEEVLGEVSLFRVVDSLQCSAG